VHDLKELNLCLLASWIKYYNLAENKFLENDSGLQGMILLTLICFGQLTEMPLLFGKGWLGLLMQPGLGADGKLEMSF
jgi:hypothetical protein